MLWSFFACVVLHELGHSLMARRFGVGVRRILLLPIGGMAEFESIPREPRRELLITLAGPAVNFVIAGVFWGLIYLLGALSTWNYPAAISDFLDALLWGNLVMGLFNLVPVFPMDGGRIFRALLATRMSYLRATFFAATVGKIIAALAVGMAIVVVVATEEKEEMFQASLLAALFTFILVMAELEFRTTKTRETADSRRLTIPKLAPGTPSTPEPPLLTAI